MLVSANISWTYCYHTITTTPLDFLPNFPELHQARPCLQKETLWNCWKTSYTLESLPSTYITKVTASSITATEDIILLLSSYPINYNTIVSYWPDNPKPTSPPGFAKLFNCCTRQYRCDKNG